jgi:phage host-nuclease inhibitor protein Gam
MFDATNPLPYIVTLLIATLAYFLKDAHTNLKAGLEQKATQQALEDAKTEWRADLRDLQERHQRETARLEHQYEQKFAAVVSQFQDRMDSVERNLQGRMDLILELLKQRTP